MTDRTRGFPARLTRAITDWGNGKMNVSAFAREMQARDTRGSSRGQILNYLRGSLAPPLDFIENAATVLGVPFTWLATGTAHDDAPVCAACVMRERKVQEAVRLLTETP